VPIAGDPCSTSELREAYEIHTVGETSIPSVYYDRDAEGTCVERPAGGTPYATSGGIAPPTDFVAATIVESTGLRLLRRHFVAEDGAFGGASFFNLFDSVLGERCYSRPATDGSLRCMPNFGTPNNMFADASCTQDLFQNGPFECGDRFRFAAVDVEEACGVARDGTALTFPLLNRLYELEDPVVPAALHRFTYDDTGATVCAPTTVLPEDGVYSALGPEVSPSSLAVLEETEVACGRPGASGQRLRVRDLVSEGQSASRTSLPFDSAIGEYCEFNVAADGVLRCLPTQMDGISGGFFADSACTRRVLDVPRCRLGRQSNYAQTGETAPGECVAGANIDEVHIIVHSLGERYTPTALYTSEEVAEGEVARCLPIEESRLLSVAEITLEFEFREVGPEVPPSTFVAGHVETY
jgi:hypothetical protein